MNKKKIIRISTVPQSLDVFLKGQLKMLSEYYEVIAVSSPGDALYELEKREGVRTVAVPMERQISVFKDILSLVRLIKLFHKEKPYAVHAMCGKAELLAMMAAWLTRVPVRIDTLTGLYFPTAKGWRKLLFKITDSLVCFCANYINPEGYGVKKCLENAKITSKPLHVIGNGNIRGLDLEFYNRTKEVIDESNKIRNEEILTFCFVGRLVKDKGINELISSFLKLYTINKKIRLLLVGPFEERLSPLLPETIQNIREHPAIKYVGLQKDVRPYLAASDIYVFPSYREGFPNSLLEACAMGLPAIVTNINGSNEIIIPEVNGELVEPQDEIALFNKMKQWMENPSKVKEMAKNARKSVSERYEQKELWESLLIEYQKLIPSEN